MSRVRNSWLLVLLPVACSSGDGITVEDAYGYAPLVAGGSAVAYLHVENHGDAERRLVSVTSPDFARVEIHETVSNNGMSRMRAVADPAVPANGSLQLVPGGRHLMLMKAHAPVTPGQTATLTMTFDNGETVQIDVALRDRSEALAAERAP